MPRIAYLLLVVLSLFWGGSFFFIKLLLADFGPWSIAFLRAGFGLVTIVIVMLCMREPLRFTKLPWLPLVVVGLCNTAIPWSLISMSEMRLTSSMASVLNATTPLWTLIIGIIAFKAQSSRQKWMGMAVGFIGLLILLDINPQSIISVDILGFFGMIIATLFYGLASHVSKRFVVGATMYQIAFATLLVGFLGSGMLALLTEPFSLAPLAEWNNILTLIGLGVFGSGFAYIIFYFLIHQGSPEFASLVTYLVPVTAILWGYALLNEPLHWSLLAGLLFILTGVFIASRKPKTAVEQELAQGETD